MRRLPRAPMTATLALAALCAAGCVSAEEAFTDGRLQSLCNGSLVVCGVHAGCALSNEQYLEASFPGTVRVIVHSALPDARLTVRFLLTDMRHPGTELVIQAYEPACGGLDEEVLRDVDIFDLAGDEGVLELDLDLPGTGDHLLEIFSDMSSGFLLTTEVIEAY